MILALWLLFASVDKAKKDGILYSNNNGMIAPCQMKLTIIADTQKDLGFASSRVPATVAFDTPST